MSKKTASYFPVGIKFQEEMSGALGLNLDVSTALESLINMGPHACSFRILVSIDDIDRFIADPKHMASLSGLLEVSTQGIVLPISGVLFLLERVPCYPRLLMHYEFEFTHNGSDFLFTGLKYIEGPSLLAFWPQTTTLYSMIRKLDFSSEIVGAALLKISFVQVLQMVFTVKAFGGLFMWQRIFARYKFYKFFFTQLSYIYLPIGIVSTRTFQNEQAKVEILEKN